MQQGTARYLKLYGFHSPPFGLSPDPGFFYPSPGHQAAAKILGHAIENGEGFMVLSGKAGLGKTLLLRRILKNLAGNKIPILVFSPAVDARGLLQLLLGELGICYDERASLASLLQVFQNHTLKMAEEDGKELFIIIDEAQNMPAQTLEQLRMLSNLETGQRKLMQILLIGQTGLEKMLNDPGLGQLVQRIVVHERLQPLNVQQVSQYVFFRLEKAGGQGITLSGPGCRLLHKSSRGIPRLINRIMDRALLMASLDGDRALTRRHIKVAIRTMKDMDSSSRRKSRIRMAAVLVAVCIIALIAYLLLQVAPENLFSITSVAGPYSLGHNKKRKLELQEAELPMPSSAHPVI